VQAGGEGRRKRGMMTSLIAGLSIISMILIGYIIFTVIRIILVSIDFWKPRYPAKLEMSDDEFANLIADFIRDYYGGIADGSVVEAKIADGCVTSVYSESEE
jgi:hypothetical protein